MSRCGDWEDTNAEPRRRLPAALSRSVLKPTASASATRSVPLHPIQRPLHWEFNRPQSVGRVRAFYGNTGMFIRALAYILANGPMACGRPPKTRC